MTITVTRPTTTIPIITDLDTLRETITWTNHINNLPTPDNPTETETANQRKEHDRAVQKLAALADKVNASTLHATLQGLPSNEWNQLVVRCTTTRNGRTTKDLPKLLRLAFPRMLHTLTDGSDAPIETDATAINNLLDSLADSQTAEILQAIQELNTPATSLPKETLTLLQSKN